jgi:uncharacterized protein (UPF0548 family)
VFLLTQPSPSRIAAFLASQRDAALTYTEVGATRGERPPAGYAVDHKRIRLGAGTAAFERAVEALHRWRMLTHGWAYVAPAAASVVPGTTVAVVVRHYRFWSLNACRIVYVLDGNEVDAAGVRRIGFAYGTLPEHGAVGEERFTVECHAADDSVWFDMYAFSRPGMLLAWLGYPIGRRVQRRFARAAKQAMHDAVATGGTAVRVA